MQQWENLGAEVGQDVAQSGPPGRSVGPRSDRPQQPGLDQQLQVMAHRRGGDLVVLHEGDVAGGERLVTDRERAQGTDPQRVGQDPEGAGVEALRSTGATFVVARRVPAEVAKHGWRELGVGTDWYGLALRQ